MSTGKEKGMEMNEDTHKYPQLRNAEIIVHYGSKERVMPIGQCKRPDSQKRIRVLFCFLP